MRYFLFLSLLLIASMASHITLSTSLYAVGDEIVIVSRAAWGADESIRYADSPVWRSAYAGYLHYLARSKTQAEIDSIGAETKRLTYITEHSRSAAEIVERRYSEQGHPLVLPIEKTKQVNRIILHHSDSNMDTTQTDEEIIRAIYRTHTLNRNFGDIGYNYIIGQRGVIYEGRAGGDYVVGTHALSNNIGSVGIMVIGNFDRDHPNRDQLAGTERLIRYISKKYGINLKNQVPGYGCTSGVCIIHSTDALLGHQDVRATDCPGQYLYPYIAQWRDALAIGYEPVSNPTRYIESTPRDRVMNMTLRVDPVDPFVSETTQRIRYIGAKFRVRLSYPNNDTLTLSSPDTRIPTIQLDRKKIPSKVGEKIKVGIVGNDKLSLKIGERYYTGSTLRVSHTIVRIDSWSRIPDWDKSSKYNDNLFRDTIRVIAQDGKLVVINDLPLEWYLKGMGEVSNSDLTEKIKTIVVAARSYARWYMDPFHRKFDTTLYDGSDNPDEFQKYLGYSYELRSPSVSKIVDATRGQVITYSGLLIKPWYHSSSDGRTLSALEYCQKAGSSNCVDTPYLQSVADPGSEGRSRSGHGVGISGIGATYWAQIGWDYTKIIQYYLKGVEIQKK